MIDVTSHTKHAYAEGVLGSANPATRVVVSLGGQPASLFGFESFQYPRWGSTDAEMSLVSVAVAESMLRIVGKSGTNAAPPPGIAVSRILGPGPSKLRQACA